MSNMGPFGGNKNPPWARGAVTNQQIVGQTNQLQQQMMNQGQLGAMQSNLVQYQQQQQQQQQVFQTPMNLQQQQQQQNLGMGLQQLQNSAVQMNPALSQQLNHNQLFTQVNAVTYPNPRALNQTAFTNPNIANVQQSSPSNTSAKQRVFTGTVTKVHDNFGFVDEDVFFQTTACVKGSNPVVGDRVLVEATFNPNMPFKWNATRIQVLPMTASSRNTNSNNHNKSFNNSYNAVAPPAENSNGNYSSSSSRNNQRGNKSSISGRSRDRSRDRDREDEEIIERKRRREERAREREEKDKKSPLRRRSRSPKSRRRARIVPRYMVQIPKIALHLAEADVLELRRRYTHLYVPSDFFNTNFRWIDAFPPHNPFALNKPCSFHIMNKDIDPITDNQIIEPTDADYIFSAKVMLISVPTLEEIYSKCCALTEEREKKDRDSEERDFVHPTRLINFLVGLRGKNETMAIGGPWSPSLDGENPEKDPSVLIKTAIRTCRALTGIDLSNCTQWYRFVELYYRRGESMHKGRLVPARVETVVLFLPDVWSCLPTRLEWDQLTLNYKKQLERKLKTSSGCGVVPSAAASPTAEKLTEDSDGAITADEKEEEILAENKIEPTHYSQLDPKVMNVNDLRTELKARLINSKGLKSQLVARLTKALKTEAEKNEDESAVEQMEQNDAKMDLEDKDDRKKEGSVKRRSTDDTQMEEKRLDDKEKALLEKRYTLPEEQHIIVHPSKIAKSGKFDCTVMSLSLLLDYRPEDTKEHSFEVSLFAELFNEMLMRDFGFNIYKALFNLPEKMKDDKKKDDKTKKDDSSSKKDEKKDDKKKDGKKDEDDEEYDEYEDDEEDDGSKKDKHKPSSSDRDRKKKERVKLITKEKNLLLSFVYFDQTHCGYIFEKDIEDLIYTLGLNLSRAQVRKLVSKVITRDSLHYRKLTDRPKDEPEPVVEVQEHINLDEITFGNKKLLPVFENSSSSAKQETSGSNLSEGFVMYQGALMDVGKLMQQLQRSEKARIDTETYMIDLKNENHKLSDKNDKSSTIIKSLTLDLSDCKKKLQHTDDSLTKMTTYSKLYHSTLLEIRDKIEPVLQREASDAKYEVKHEIKSERKDSHESRWQANESSKTVDKEVNDN